MRSQTSQVSSSPDDSNSLNSSESIYKSPLMRKEALRNVYENAQALQSNVNVKTVENLELIVNEVDAINEEGTLEEKIKNDGEVYLDSKIMTISSEVLKTCTISLSKDVNNYDPDEFAERIRNFVVRLPDTVTLEGDEPDWSLLGNEIIKHFQRTPDFQMITGTLAPIAKKEIVRKARPPRDAQAATKRPENIITVDQTEESIEQTIENIFKVIKDYDKKYNRPLDFYALVLHPTDFGKTIENTLHVSFLIRDGYIKIIMDEEGIPQIVKCTKEEKAIAAKKKNNSQNVLTLNMKQWKALVEAYNIQRPMIDLKSKK